MEIPNLRPWHDGLESAHRLSLDVATILDACKIRVERTVERDGIEMAPGRHLSAGPVGETVTLRLLPEGGHDEADCYYHGEKIACLRMVERDGKLADSIKAARPRTGTCPSAEVVVENGEPHARPHSAELAF